MLKRYDYLTGASWGLQNMATLFFFHGFPSSRLEGAGVDKLVRRHNIRLISVDRPGFGLSTFQPGRRILDWPTDVEALATHLNLKRFAVLGGSGGGPYAVACAYSLPPEMLSSFNVATSSPSTLYLSRSIIYNEHTTNTHTQTPCLLPPSPSPPPKAPASPAPSPASTQRASRCGTLARSQPQSCTSSWRKNRRPL